MRINAILMGGAFAVLAGMATAQSREEAVSLSMLGFTSVDGDGDASLTPAEIISYGGLVFTSMDSDENEMLSEQEYVDWGWGQLSLADEQGRTQAYDATRRMIHDLGDRDNDGAISMPEMTGTLAMAFGYADLDADGALSEKEYLSGFITNVGLRNALKP